jgi:hypothetical protein
MGIFTRRSQLERVLETVDDVVDALNGNRLGRPRLGAAKPLKASLIAAGGVAGLTAASAGISSLRRRTEGAGNERQATRSGRGRRDS